jgi:hypothetical protein
MTSRQRVFVKRDPPHLEELKITFHERPLLQLQMLGLAHELPYTTPSETAALNRVQRPRRDKTTQVDAPAEGIPLQHTHTYRQEHMHETTAIGKRVWREKRDVSGPKMGSNQTRLPD